MTCALTLGWSDPRDDDRVAAEMQQIAKTYYQHGSGVYYNEPDFNLSNWKVGTF